MRILVVTQTSRPCKMAQCVENSTIFGNKILIHTANAICLKTSAVHRTSHLARAGRPCHNKDARRKSD